jgi:hypothetical protein
MLQVEALLDHVLPKSSVRTSSLHSTANPGNMRHGICLAALTLAYRINSLLRSVGPSSATQPLILTFSIWNVSAQ